MEFRIAAINGVPPKKIFSDSTTRFRASIGKYVCRHHDTAPQETTMKTTTQTTRINGKRVVIRTSPKGKVTVADAPIKESEGQAAQVRALRSMPEYGRQFLLAGDMNSAKRGPRAQADAIATGMTPGEADLRIYLKGGVLRMIENKVGKGRLSPAQVERHASLARLGHPVAVVRFTSTAEAASKAVELVKGWLADNDNHPTQAQQQ